MDCYTLRVHRFQPEVQIVVVRGDGANRDVPDKDSRSVPTAFEAQSARFSFRFDESEVFLRNKMGVDIDRLDCLSGNPSSPGGVCSRIRSWSSALN